MSDDFTRDYSGFRWVETRRGDTLRALAARELQDASRWWEIASINQLTPPYLTDDPAAVRAGVVLTGARLAVPAGTDLVQAAVDAALVFGIDVQLTQGRLTATGGDLDVIAGAPNLTQAIRHVVQTDLGGLIWHPQYGCGVHALLGQRNGPQAMLMADALVRRAVQRDARIDHITASTTTVGADIVRVELTAMAINGVTVRVSA